MPLYIGLISGTSMDGVDGALVEIIGEGPPRLLATRATPLPSALCDELATLIATAPVGSPNLLVRLGELDHRLGELVAGAALALLEEAGVAPKQVRAIGSHGQTLYHHPSGTAPFTLQIGDPNRIAERCGITTVADFRRRDMAAGGQGAPLLPALHAHLLRHPVEWRAVLNLGGIANLTLIPPSTSREPVTGFDSGPANALLDAWIERHRGEAMDREGAWAASGRVDPVLLERLLADPYFALAPPKSSGREYFHLPWLDTALSRHPDLPPVDVQATLAELSAVSVIRALRAHQPHCARLLVCGGGVHNRRLMARLEDLLRRAEGSGTAVDTIIESTAAHGVDPDWMEAIGFAWFAHRTLEGLAGNLPEVTGARHAVPLGAIHPA